MSLRALLALSISLITFAGSARAQLDSQIDAPMKMPVDDTSAALRGYGKIHLTQSLKNGVTTWKFEATSETNAQTAVAKFLADLNLSPEVTADKLGVHNFPLVTVPGGAAYTGYTGGSTGYVVSAKDAAALKTVIESMPGTGISNTDLKYPPYLDRFDRHGWAFYGFGGNFGKLQPSPGDGSTDPDDDMAWISKYNFRFELWPQPEDFDDNWSVSQRHTHAWLLDEAKEHNVPVSGRLYGGLPHVKQFTDLRDEQQPFMEGGWYWPILGYRDYPKSSWFSKPSRLYMARQARDEVNMYADHPEIESWMMPYGEVGTYDWYIYHGDVSKSAQDDWHDTIQNQEHLSLGELSEMYGRKDKPFKSYADVPIPEVATFAGLPGEIQDLEGDWHVKVESKPHEGADGQWWAADLKDWDHLHMPGSVYWFKYSLNNDYLPKWVDRDFEYDAAKANGQPVYLYDFARAENNDGTKTMPVYLNGQKVADVASWGAWDVTKLLKPGTNRLALNTEMFSGRIFLSTDKPMLYPYLGPERNKLWTLFNQWLSDGRSKSAEVALAGIRAAEPNKPIKIMAPPFEQKWLDLESKYGAWGHFTGEGTWAFFWYKRFDFLYGVPGTSEGGGPGDLKSLVLLYQRVMLEGINGHDQVFSVQFITGLPDEKKFFEDHMAVIKQMGRYDIAGPQVVIYRSNNKATALMPGPLPLPEGASHEIQSIWNWDFARGTYQSAGYSGLYVDDGGIATGKIARYPLMMDGGNEILTPPALKSVADWVKAGGTYIALPFTGRSIPSAPDSWPIQDITGCTVSKMRTPGQGSVTISPDNAVFKDLAGKTFSDNGSDKEGNGTEHNLLSTELKPGADCTVLATYEDGAPAIVLHKLGKGRVITLGSMFFNHIQDKVGMWLPDQQGTDFFRDFFTGLGFPSPNWTNENLVLTQRYRTNNGLDDAVVLDNFSGADKTVDLKVAVDRKPEKAYRVAMNQITEVPFTLDDHGLVTIAQQAIPKDEVQLYYFRSHPAEDAVAHWWEYQQKMWHPLTPDKVDFASVSHGRFVDQAVDLKSDWNWTQDAGADAMNAGTVPAQSATHQPWPLDIYNAKGADPAKAVYAWRTFKVEPQWLHDGGVTKLTAVGSDFDFAQGHWEFHLNGQLLKKDGYYNPDVSSFLKAGDNLLTLKLEPNQSSKYIGVLGALYVTHAKKPVKRVDLAGAWNTNPPGIGDARTSGGATIQLPGKGSAFLPTRSIDIPADWEKKYIVTYYAKGARGSAIGAIVNEGGVIRRHDHFYGDECEVDITRFLKFGAANTIAMLSTGGQSLDPSHDWDVQQVELRCYPREEYR